MRYFGYALALVLFYATIVLAAEVKFDIEWQPPLNEDGTPQDVDSYVVYACDEEMPDTFGGTLSDNPIIGICPNGVMVTYEVPGDRTDLQKAYPVFGKKKKGTVYLRVTARNNFTTEVGPQYLEGEPSNQVSFSYFAKPGKVTGVVVEEIK